MVPTHYSFFKQTRQVLKLYPLLSKQSANYAVDRQTVRFQLCSDFRIIKLANMPGFARQCA